MAQWLGQFSGNTHATAVQEAEALFRQAIENGRMSENPKRAKALAKRVFTARRRFLKAGASVAQDAIAIGNTSSQQTLMRLEQALLELEAGGLTAILEEFGIAPR